MRLEDENGIAHEFVIADIDRVEAFKRDFFAIDQYCFEVFLKNGGHLIVNEDMKPNFIDFAQFLSQSPLYSESLAKSVYLPGFEECRTIVFPIREDEA